MRKFNSGEWLFSPSDLTTYMASPFASWMEHAAVVKPELKQKKDKPDALLQSLQTKGYQHEADFYESLKSAGTSQTFIDIEEECADNPIDATLKKERTLEAMIDGIDIIFQGCLELESFRGHSDFLVKVPGRSCLGDYHYEVWDTKLSKSVKPYFIIQLCAYAEMLEAVQGRRPEFLTVVLGTNEQVRLKTDEHFFAYQALKTRFLEMHDTFDLNTPFDPADAKDWGNWSEYAKSLLVARDHLIQVANITRAQIAKLNAAGIDTMAQLATSSLSYIPKLKPETFAKLKDQASIQVETRERQAKGDNRPAFRVIQPVSDTPKGLSLLPPSSPLDVFFDIEGDPMIEGGLEYLWGVTYFNAQGERDFIDFWAHDQEQEKQAFIDFIDWVYARWKQDPGMHVYHYAYYEITAIRKLMGRYGVCEDKVDTLFRQQVFVDLYAIVRHGLIIGEPRYSIKNVEHIYRGVRETEVASGGDSVVVYEAWRENPDGQTWHDSKVLNDIRLYNKDDCDSTQELVDWLRGLQQQEGIEFVGKQGADSKEPDADKIERAQAKRDLYDALLQQAVSLKPHHPDEADIAALFAQLLFFHEREAKPVWWKLFDRLAQQENELYEDAECLAFAQRTSSEPFKQKPRDRNLCFEYRYDPEQEFKIPALGNKGKSFYLLDEAQTKVTLVEFDANENTFLLKTANEPPAIITLIPDDYINPSPIPESIELVAKAYLDGELETRALLKFLRRDTVEIREGLQTISETKNSEQHLQAINHLVLDMSQSVLAVQGPPGAGKTYTAKQMILALLKAGKRIGITSNSHKAIFNLLESVATLLGEHKLSYPLFHTNVPDQEAGEALGIKWVKNSDILANIASCSKGFVVGTTAWGFSRIDMADQLDYLFIDEAGQVSLANLVGMSPAANNLILLGDQMQLGQPIQGSHPEPTDQSILSYYLQQHHTIPAELGIFLGTSYRMHPDVNHYISQAFYEGRLASAAQCANQKLIPSTQHPDIKRSSGVVKVEVSHAGNSQASDEEVTKIVELKNDLLGQTFIDHEGNQREITLADILFIAPYNHQVGLLKRALGPQAKVGSVDLFQGQEAPIVIVSMCASRADETARGVEFILNPNRLNVAISRAQVLAIIVASTTLTDIELKTLEQIELVNRFELLNQHASVQEGEIYA